MIDFVINYLAQTWNYWWDLCLNYYQVNPFIFIAMYSTKSVIFWWTIALIVKHCFKREWNSLPPLVLLNVTTNVSPWVYIWICGRNQPWWYPYMVYFVGGWGCCYLAWEIRRRLQEAKQEDQAKGAEATEKDLETALAPSEVAANHEDNSANSSQQTADPDSSK